MTKIQFKDTEATLSSFHYTETYSTFLEGHPILASWELLKDLHEMMKEEEDLVFVHQGEVMSAEKLNEIERFDDESLIRNYMWELWSPGKEDRPEETEEHPFIELGRGKYVAHFHIGYEYLLTMVWYDDKIDISRSLKEIIEEIARSIEYKKHCKFYDLDNL